jgi:cell division septation protein DedD
MRAALVAAGLLLATAGQPHAQAAAARGPDEVRRLVAADRYPEARRALRAWWAASGDTATGARRASALYLRAVLTDSLPAAERDLLRVVVEHPLAPESDDALLRLAHVRLLRGDSAGAAGHLDRLGTDFPQSPLRASGLALLGRLRPADVRVASAPPRAAAPPPRAAPARPSSPSATSAATRAPALPTPARSARREPAPRLSRYTVEVAAEGSMVGASGTRDRLKARGFNSFLVVDGDDSTVRVRLGNFPNRDAAESLAGRLRDAGYLPTVLPSGG